MAGRRTNKSWREHAGPYLSRALKQASKTWKPKKDRTDYKKVKALQKQRDRLNALIKKEKAK